MKLKILITTAKLLKPEAKVQIQTLPGIPAISIQPKNAKENVLVSTPTVSFQICKGKQEIEIRGWVVVKGVKKQATFVLG